MVTHEERGAWRLGWYRKYLKHIAVTKPSRGRERREKHDLPDVRRCRSEKRPSDPIDNLRNVVGSQARSNFDVCYLIVI